jgi:polyferredoxin
MRAATAPGLRDETAPIPVAIVPRSRTAFIRRRPDQAHGLRRATQAAFLLLNLWIGARFYLFVRYFESGGQGVFVPRPPGVEGWLPIAALMNLKYLILTGLVPEIHPAGLFLFVAFVGMSLAARKAFCSWLCPVGTISEWLWLGGQGAFGRTLSLPRWADIPLRGLKYLLLGFFLYAVLPMSAGEIRTFVGSPYGLVADVKMLDFFRALGTTSAVIIGVLVAWSVVAKNPWCRYLCPYGALLGLVAFASPARIRRHASACIDCAKCAKACPSLLPVDRVTSVRSAECTGCVECVTACPAQDALRLGVGRSASMPAWGIVAVIAVCFLGLVGYARLTNHWQGTIPDAAYRELIPSVSSLAHPQ